MHVGQLRTNTFLSAEGLWNYLIRDIDYNSIRLSQNTFEILRSISTLAKGVVLCCYDASNVTSYHQVISIASNIVTVRGFPLPLTLNKMKINGSNLGFVYDSSLEMKDKINGNIYRRAKWIGRDSVILGLTFFITADKTGLVLNCYKNSLSVLTSDVNVVNSAWQETGVDLDETNCHVTYGDEITLVLTLPSATQMEEFVVQLIYCTK